MKKVMLQTAAALVILAIGLALNSHAAEKLTAGQARALAKEAYIYGFPLVENYRVAHAYFIDAAGPDYKAPFNTIKNIPRVYTPLESSVRALEADILYSVLGADLRAEPVVLTVPAVDGARYYSIQLNDAFTFNFDCIGSRTTGNGEGSYLIAGPGWKGAAPAGINKVMRSETNFVTAIFRTQLLNPDDLAGAKKIQDGYKVQALSAFIGKRKPKAGKKIKFIRPLSPADQKTSLEFFNVLNFALQFCRLSPEEKTLMSRLSPIGIRPGGAINFGKRSPELMQAMRDGMADAWKAVNNFISASVDTGAIQRCDLFGSRSSLKNNYLYRFAGAALGLYHASKEDTLYRPYLSDADGRPLDAASSRYVLRFEPDQLPPVNASWSLTMYRVPEGQLVPNHLNRYFISSAMLGQLKRDGDGGLTLFIQRESPGWYKESNWLPAPEGPFMAVLRLYWPKEQALSGAWKLPPVQLMQ